MIKRFQVIRRKENIVWTWANVALTSLILRLSFIEHNILGKINLEKSPKNHQISPKGNEFVKK